MSTFGGCAPCHRVPSQPSLGGSNDDDTHSTESLQLLFAKCCTSTKDVDADGGDLRIRPDSPFDEVDADKAGAPRFSPATPPTPRMAKDQSRFYRIHCETRKGAAAVVTPGKGDESSAESSAESVDFSAEFANEVRKADEAKAKAKASKSDAVVDEDVAFENLSKVTASGAQGEIEAVIARKDGASAKVGLIFTRSKDTQATIISKMLPESIFSNVKGASLLEGATVLAVNEVQVLNPRHAAEMVYRAEKEVRLTIISRGDKKKTAQQEALEEEILKQEQRLLKEKLAREKKERMRLPSLRIANEVTEDDPAIEEYDSADDDKEAEDDGHSVATADWSQAYVVESAFPEKKVEQETKANASPAAAKEVALARVSAPVTNDEAAKDGKKSKMASIRRAFGLKAPGPDPEVYTELDGEEPVSASAKEIMNDLEGQGPGSDGAGKGGEGDAKASDAKGGLPAELKGEAKQADGNEESEAERPYEDGDIAIKEPTYTLMAAGEEETELHALEEPSSMERATSYIIESIVTNLSYCDESTDERDEPMTNEEHNKTEGADKVLDVDGTKQAVAEDAKVDAVEGDEGEEEARAGTEPKENVPPAVGKKKGLIKRAFGKKSPRSPKGDEAAVSDANEKAETVVPKADSDSESKEAEEDSGELLDVSANSAEAGTTQEAYGAAADESSPEVGTLDGKALLLGQPVQAKKPKKKSFLKRAFSKSKRLSKEDSVLGVTNESVDDSASENANFTRGIDLNVTLTGDVEVLTPSQRGLLDCPLSPIPKSPSKKLLDVPRTGSNATVSVTTTDESASVPTVEYAASTPPSRSSASGQLLPPTPPTPTKIGESWDVSFLFGLQNPPSPSESIIGATPARAERVNASPASREEGGVDESISFECRLQDESAMDICVEAQCQDEPRAPPKVNRKLSFSAADDLCKSPFQSRAIDVVTTVHRDGDDEMQLAQAKQSAFDIAKQARKGRKAKLSDRMKKNPFTKRVLSDASANNDVTHATADLTGDASMLCGL